MEEHVCVLTHDSRVKPHHSLSFVCRLSSAQLALAGGDATAGSHSGYGALPDR